MHGEAVDFSRLCYRIVCQKPLDFFLSRSSWVQKQKNLHEESKDKTSQFFGVTHNKRKAGDKGKKIAFTGCLGLFW